MVLDDLSEELADEVASLPLVVIDGGERLDRWLAVRLPEHSRSEIQRWIDDGLVTQGPRPLKASYRVVAGDVITVIVPEPGEVGVAAEPIPLDVAYEDADLLVVNKPAGMVVHPAAGNWHGTLVNAVLYHCPDLEGVGGAHRPGIVHRLDKDTSGLILVAKNDAAQRSLQAQFKSRTVHKTYMALVHGWLTPKQGEINAPIGRDPRQRQRMAVVSLSRGRGAVTQYQVSAYYAHVPGTSNERFSLVACHPLTGRTHQLRVHLAHIRHPIVGDKVYGGHHRLSFTCPRQFLHAERIRFRLPSTGTEVEFTAGLPDDLRAVLDVLGVAG